jgi:hypothetical protein
LHASGPSKNVLPQPGRAKDKNLEVQVKDLKDHVKDMKDHVKDLKDLFRNLAEQD